MIKLPTWFASFESENKVEIAMENVALAIEKTIKVRVN
jgi:hypothetical protein